MNLIGGSTACNASSHFHDGCFTIVKCSSLKLLKFPGIGKALCHFPSLSLAFDNLDMLQSAQVAQLAPYHCNQFGGRQSHRHDTSKN